MQMLFAIVQNAESHISTISFTFCAKNICRTAGQEGWGGRFAQIVSVIKGGSHRHKGIHHAQKAISANYKKKNNG